MLRIARFIPSASALHSLVRSSVVSSAAIGRHSFTTCRSTYAQWAPVPEQRSQQPAHVQQTVTAPRPRSPHSSAAPSRRGPFRALIRDEQQAELRDENALRAYVLKELSSAPRVGTSPTIARRALLDQLPLSQIIALLTSFGRDTAPASRRREQQTVYFSLMEKPFANVSSATPARGPFLATRTSVTERDFNSESALRSYISEDLRTPNAEGALRCKLSAAELTSMSLEDLIAEWLRMTQTSNASSGVQRSIRAFEQDEQIVDSQTNQPNMSYAARSEASQQASPAPASVNSLPANTDGEQSHVPSIASGGWLSLLQQRDTETQDEVHRRAEQFMHRSSESGSSSSLHNGSHGKSPTPASDTSSVSQERSPLRFEDAMRDASDEAAELGDVERAESMLAPHVDILASRVQHLFDEAAASLAHQPGVHNESEEQMGAAVRAHFRAHGFAMLTDTDVDAADQHMQGHLHEHDHITRP